ncbi:hypothetical protein ACN4EK_22680 [Pantanalinema rosaneae CENA516]|uniref:hypothetical protein n=1 Tax=Pantanalinema rosaneae TaxID=1620701 RepID=UPI003D6DED2C
MQPSASKKYPLQSLTLLLISYTVFGWYLSSPSAPRLSQLGWVCPLLERIIALREPITDLHHYTCLAVIELAVQRNLLGIIMTVGWIFLLSVLFMSPLTSFTRFITHWFRSDTVAFLTICMMASLAAVMLFWLHVFIQILLIMAAESLARLDIQTLGLDEWQAFWLLSTASLIGLAIGWMVYWVFNHEGYYAAIALWHWIAVVG